MEEPVSSNIFSINKNTSEVKVKNQKLSVLNPILFIFIIFIIIIFSSLTTYFYLNNKINKQNVNKQDSSVLVPAQTEEKNSTVSINESKECPDGTFVAKKPNSNEFYPCPRIDQKDLYNKEVCKKYKGKWKENGDNSYCYIPNKELCESYGGKWQVKKKESHGVGALDCVLIAKDAGNSCLRDSDCRYACWAKIKDQIKLEKPVNYCDENTIDLIGKCSSEYNVLPFQSCCYEEKLKDNICMTE